MKQTFKLSTVTVVVPAFIKYWNKKKRVFENCYLNLNVYSNWHGIKRNNIKKQFTREVKDEIDRIPNILKIHSLKYTLVRTTNVKRDRMNVYSIVDKFFCDALQEYGKIEDDSDEFINEFNFTKTEYIKGSPTDIRVQVEIYFEEKL